MAQPEETQLESSVPGRQQDLDKVVETSSGPVFDGLSSSSLKLCGGLMRTCSECGKQFSSGKALGGHKRACLQRKNTNAGFKLKPSVKMKVGAELGKSNVVEGGEEHRCFVCGQCFANLKSLYGHMRKHPERQWRGIHPPQKQQQPLHHHHHLSASSTISNDLENDDDPDDYYDGDYVDEGGGGLDLVEPLKGWSVKDKRGRKSSWKEVDPEDKEAVGNLFFLASASHKLESGEGQSSTKKTKICSSGYVLLKGKERRHEADHDLHDLHDHDQDISEMGQQQKKRKLSDFEPPNTSQRFECQLCKKAFDKHQALGGHVASHNNKSKIKNLSVKELSPCVDEERGATAGESDQEDSGDIGDDDDGDDHHQPSRVNGEQCHQCNICSKIFPTGQALGGHKRCHWPGPVPETFSSSSQLTTSTGCEVSQSQTPPRRGGELLAGGLDIDLNDTPEEFYQFFGFPEPHQEAGVASNDSPVR